MYYFDLSLDFVGHCEAHPEEMYTMKIRISLLLLLVSTSLSPLWTQTEKSPQVDLDPGILIGLDYGYNIVGGDMKERFDNNLQVGAKVSYLFKNINFQVGLRGTYFFGDTVKQDVLAHLRDTNGHIIGINGDYAQVKLRQRGFDLGIFGSYVFPFKRINERSGLRIDLGVSLLQHWIRLQDDYNTVAQFDDPYQKGYDRLTNGLALNQFIGFQYLSTNRRVNFYAGFSFTQAWTESRRDYDFSSLSSDLGNRFDLMSGIKVGWILPIYMESQPDELFY